MDLAVFADIDLLVPLDAPTTEKRPWNPRTPSLKNNLHIGQLKLLASELAFMTLGTNEDLSKCVVVYAGAAGGHHIPVLANLFRETKFYLYDPAPFAIEPTEQLNIISGMFTDTIASEWGSKENTNVLFISDVRTSGDTSEEHESEVEANMAMQAKWVELLRPNLKAYSLKFRIPYTTIESDRPFPYLNGNLVYQPYPKPDSMELRLIGNAADAAEGSEAVTYDSRSLEQIVFFHNSVIRPNQMRYANVCSETNKPYADPQFDNGYDCTFFLYSIRRYLERYKGMTVCEDTEPIVLRMARRMIHVTSRGFWSLETRKEQHRLRAGDKRRV